MASFNSDENKENFVYIFKSNILYGYIDKFDLFIYDDKGIPNLKNEDWDRFLDLLPEGIDLKIMKYSFNIRDDKELFKYLTNPVGDFSFSTNKNHSKDDIIMSDIKIDDFSFPNICYCHIDIEEQALFPKTETNANRGDIQRLSLSGFQHKLQIFVKDNTIKQDYGDFILKPANEEYFNLAINEHLHTTFMKEFGFEVPFNAIIYDERCKEYHYFVRRFDIAENGKKIPQISLNALMRQPNKMKYEGSIESCCKFIQEKGILSNEEKYKFLKFIYANAILFNADLHKKNISFMIKNDKLILTPVYDIINLYPIKSLTNAQTALPINGKKDKIQISYFKKLAEILDINKNILINELKTIFEIYKDKYIEYIDKISEIPNVYKTKEFKQKFKETYDKNLKINNIQKQEIKQSNITDKIHKIKPVEFNGINIDEIDSNDS